MFTSRTNLDKIKLIIIPFLVSMTLCAQSKVIKASYELSGLSDFIIEGLKKIPDLEKRNEITRKIESSKIYYSMYHNPKTNESIFVMDSLRIKPKVQLGAYNFYTYTNSNGEIEGKDFFLRKEVFFKGHRRDLVWNPTDEKKDFDGISNTKFTLKDYPYTHAWVSLNDTKIGAGPYFFQGLPGEVLKINGPLISMSLKKIFTADIQEFEQHKSRILKEEKKGSITLQELLKRKDAFFQMAKNKN